jgi:taurine--2-oxoglutarate transaminase
MTRRPATSPPPAPSGQAHRFFFSWTAQRDAVPFEIAGGEGATFRTTDGARWLDFGSMVWNANLGHGHAAMRAALSQAAGLGRLATPWSVFPEKTRATELLLDVAPAGLAAGKVFLCLSGAEANENAIKMAMQLTGRRKIIHRDRSYHGATLAMLAVSGDPRKLPFAGAMPDIGVAWKDPYSATACEGDLEDLVTREGADTVAAVILEGVVGANGVLVPPVSYYRRIRQICDKHNILFIADEVLSGFGRTGRWFAVDHDGVSPDMVTCAKGLTAGYAPGGAVIASGRVARHFDDHTLLCGLTAYAHPLTCAAIVAAITAYRDEGLVSRAARFGERLKRRLPLFARQHRMIRETRGLGLLWALDLTDGRDAANPASAAQMRALAVALRAEHVHLHKRDSTVFIAPPLVVTEDELDDGFTRISRALGKVWS